jgi:hypothetical protein
MQSRTRHLPAVTSLLLLLLLGVGDAQSLARRPLARFQASLSGTYKTTATITESGCSAGASANGAPIAIPPVTTAVSDHVTFASVAANPIQVRQIPGPRLLAEHVRHPMMLRVSDSRAGSLTSTGAVAGCRPPTPLDRAASCGTRTETLPTDIVGGTQGLQLGFALIGASGTPRAPEDIFNACPLGQGQLWFGKFVVPAASVSASAIFNRHKRTIIITGGRSGEFNLHHANIASVGQFSESYTLTLRRTK